MGIRCIVTNPQLGERAVVGEEVRMLALTSGAFFFCLVFFEHLGNVIFCMSLGLPILS